MFKIPMATMENEKWEKLCGCKGIRSCLLCEAMPRDVSEGPCLPSSSPSVSVTNAAARGANISNSEERTTMIKKRYLYCPQCQQAHQPWTDHEEHRASGVPFPGVIVVKSFITPEEQTELVANIDQTHWVKSQSGRRKQDYGPKVNFKKKKLKMSVFIGLPEFSRNLVQRLNEVKGLKDFQPVELCNLEYVPEHGSAIDPHFDDFWLWGERLVTINLLSSTNLLMTNDYNPDMEVAIEMPVGSLIVLFGPARYKWKHAIQREDILSRRIAMTFRELTEEFLEGGDREDLGNELLNIASTFKGVAVGAS